MEKYDNLGMVGEGSYGMVMKCKHKETGQIVAIKKFLESEDDKMVKKIAMREVRMLRKLRHENLVNLIEVFRRRKRLYLVFEFVDHTVLDDLEKYPNGLSEMTVRKILWQVLRGVEFCHSHNIIHRDIKPENILNSRSGVIKICDFGFARSLAAHGEIYTDYVATRWYRAPELLVGDTKYGRGIDIWAVGCLIGEMMTGDPIFPGKSDIDQIFRIVRCLGNLSPRHREIFQRNPLFAGMRLPEVKEVEQLEKKFPKFSPEITDLMRQCLRLDPNDRPSSSSLLRHEFFRRDNFEEKVIPEIRARIQKEYQQNQAVRKSLAERQQQKREEDAENKKKKRKESNTSGSKDQTLPTPPTNSNVGVKLQEINKDSPRNDSKNLPNKKDPNVNSPRKESLASLNTQNKTPPSDEMRKKKEAEKDRKLPAAIKQDNSVVTGPAKPQTQKQQTPPAKPPSQTQKQSPSKEDFSTPRTLIPKVTNESVTRDALKNTSQEASKSPIKDKSPRDAKVTMDITSDKKHVKISTDVDTGAKAMKLTKTPPLGPEKSPKQPKASILKNPSQTGLRGSREGIGFDDTTVRGSLEGVAEKRGNIKPEQDILPLTKSISDTVAFREKKVTLQEKQSISTPTTPGESTPQLKPMKLQHERSPKKSETHQNKSQKDTILDKKDRPSSSKHSNYHIPPIQSQTGPAQSSKTGQNETEASVDALKQLPSQGIRVMEKGKKLSPTKDSFSPQTSYEKNMYGGTVSNFEKMMLSMSGATSISHPAIKKSTTTSNQTGGTSNSPYSQSQSPYSQQFGVHFSRDDNKPSGSNLPLWSTNPQSYFDKHHSHRNSMQDGKGTDVDRKHKSDEKSHHHHHHHHRHHHKHEDKSTDDKQGKHSKVHEEKVSLLDSKRTRLPDLMGRGMGVGGMSTSRTDDFPGFKQTGNEYQKRSKAKAQVSMKIPSLDPSQSTKQYNSTSPSDGVDSNFPYVKRKL